MNNGPTIIDAAHLESENSRLQADNKRLREAVEAVLKTWKRAGPNGSCQFEKFDHCIRLCEMALEPTVAQRSSE